MDDSTQGSASSKELNAPFFIKVSGLRGLLLTLAAVSVMAQPIWQIYYKDQDSARASENLKVEKNAESALAMSKAAISEVAILSTKYGELKVENMALKEKLESLTREYTDLLAKYKHMEEAYSVTLVEKRKLEARIDELFSKHANDKVETPRAR